jgi:hypothetical protein
MTRRVLDKLEIVREDTSAKDTSTQRRACVRAYRDESGNTRNRPLGVLMQHNLQNGKQVNADDERVERGNQ